MFQNYKTKTLKKDILSGIIVALVSIPISMGYAQVAGLPVVYGLYGSLLPILVFSLITSSPQFVFGVDATPAALVGATLASLGIVTGSGEAIRLVPVITLVTAGWLLLFYIVREDEKIVYVLRFLYSRRNWQKILRKHLENEIFDLTTHYIQEETEKYGAK